MVVSFQGPIINYKWEGGLDDFSLYSEILGRGLLQNHRIYFVDYSVIRKFSGATQNFSIDFLLSKGLIS